MVHPLILGTIYDPKMPTKYITYLNKINLYGCAMSKCLSVGGFCGI